MKTLIAAGLAASALLATTAATAHPIYPVRYHHPIHHGVIVRAPVVYRHGFPIARVYARPIVYRTGYLRPGFHRAPYYAYGHRGVIYRAPYHAYGWGHGPIHHHIGWRGAYAGEHHHA